ncbi:hypothetical protein [Tellurirhabdus rosea]|uniref:hypothetical protein n=1 Tax=Tellurirhabdus rosea TaxID=2674997 RepID=UPI00225B854C|nr:hypothetical protein [Tellurirhabdus rosea]
MRYRFFTVLLIALSLTACNGFLTPDDKYTTSVAKARRWLVGEWKLTKVSAMMPNPPVPNVRLVASEEAIIVFKDGKEIDRVGYELSRKDDYLELKTSAEPKADNWYVRNSTAKVARNRLFLDTGMAFDAPGYEFERIE